MKKKNKKKLKKKEIQSKEDSDEVYVVDGNPSTWD